MAYTKMPTGMDSWAPYLPGANLIKDRSTKCLGHPREAYEALREKKLAVGQDQRATSTPGATKHLGGVRARAARHRSSQLNLIRAISWVRDMVGLSSTDTPSIPELQHLTEATQIGEPTSSSTEVIIQVTIYKKKIKWINMKISFININQINYDANLYHN